MRGFIFALAVICSGQACAQGLSVLQGGPWTPGHAPMYVNPGFSQPIVTDSGPAGGGDIGVGLNEFNVTARGTGVAPYAGQGTGPLGTVGCFYDAPITNATGYHYLCFSANAQGGPLITSGFGGGASGLPLTFNINGTSYPFPTPVAATSVRVVTSGSITVSATDTTVACNKSIAAATPVSLPSVASRSGLSLAYVDWSGLCGDTTFTPNGSETISGLSTWIVGSGGVAGSGGSITLVPSTELSGWLVQ